MGAPLQWEQSQDWAGRTSSSLRSIHPQLPAAAGTGGAPPGTAALGGERRGRRRERGEKMRMTGKKGSWIRGKKLRGKVH